MPPRPELLKRHRALRKGKRYTGEKRARPVAKTELTKHKGAARTVGAQPGNSNALTHGVYSENYTDRELSLLVKYCATKTIEDEIGLARITTSRLAEAVNNILTEGADGGDQRPDAETIERLYGLLFGGLRTVSKLVRDQRLISGDTASDNINLMTAAATEVLEAAGFLPA